MCIRDSSWGRDCKSQKIQKRWNWIGKKWIQGAWRGTSANVDGLHWKIKQTEKAAWRILLMPKWIELKLTLETAAGN